MRAGDEKRGPGSVTSAPGLIRTKMLHQENVRTLGKTNISLRGICQGRFFQPGLRADRAAQQTGTRRGRMSWKGLAGCLIPKLPAMETEGTSPRPGRNASGAKATSTGMIWHHSTLCTGDVDAGPPAGPRRRETGQQRAPVGISVSEARFQVGTATSARETFPASRVHRRTTPHLSGDSLRMAARSVPRGQEGGTWGHSCGVAYGRGFHGQP